MVTLINYTSEMAWDALQNGSIVNAAHIGLQAAWMTPIGSIFYSLLFLIIVVSAYVKIESPFVVGVISIIGNVVLGGLLLPQFAMTFYIVLIVTFGISLVKIFVGSSADH